MSEHIHDQSCGCGCGHDHHEQEHYSHGRGHDHHEQEHHACGCGHDHHEQEHHGHGHDHGESCGCAQCTGSAGLHLTHAEGATAATARFALTGARGVAEVELSARIKALAADVSAAGGLVGHIKAALTGAPEVTTFSCTGGAVTVGRRTAPEHYTVELVAIVLGLADQVLTAAVLGRFPEIGAGAE